MYKISIENTTFINSVTSLFIRYPLYLPNDKFVYKINIYGTGILIGPYVKIQQTTLEGIDLEDIDFDNITLNRIQPGPFTGTPKNVDNQYTIKKHVHNETYNFLIGPNMNFEEFDFTQIILDEKSNFQNCTFDRIIPGPILGYSSNENLPINYEFHSFNNQNMIVGPGINFDNLNLSFANFTLISLENCTFNNTVTYPLFGKPDSLPEDYAYLTLSNSYSCIIGPHVDLSGIKFDYTDLSNLCFQDTNLMNTTFNHTITGPLNNTSIIRNLPSEYNLIRDSDSYTYIIGKNTIPNGINLKNLDLSGIDITDIDLKIANFNNTHTVNLKGSSPKLPLNYRFIDVNNIKCIVGPYVDLNGVSFNSYNMENLNLRHASITNCTFVHSRTGPLKGKPKTLPTQYTFKYIYRDTEKSYIIGPNVDLSGADLSGISLNNKNLLGVNMVNANLHNVTFINTIGGPLYINDDIELPQNYYVINNANNQKYIIGPKMYLKDYDLRGVDLSGINLSGAKYKNTIGGPLKRNSGYPIVSSEYELYQDYDSCPFIFGKQIIIKYINFTEFSMIQLNNDIKAFANTVLYRADFSGMDLNGYNFSDSDLSGAILTNTKTGPLIGTSPMLSEKYYFRTNCRQESYIIGPKVDLSGVSFEHIDLTNLDLSDVNIYNIIPGPLINVFECKQLPENTLLKHNYHEEYYFINKNVKLSEINFALMDLSNESFKNFALGGVNLSYSITLNLSLENATLIDAIIGVVIGKPKEIDLPEGYNLNKITDVTLQNNLNSDELYTITGKGIKSVISDSEYVWENKKLWISSENTNVRLTSNFINGKVNEINIKFDIGYQYVRIYVVQYLETQSIIFKLDVRHLNDNKVLTNQLFEIENISHIEVTFETNSYVFKYTGTTKTHVNSLHGYKTFTVKDVNNEKIVGYLNTRFIVKIP